MEIAGLQGKVGESVQIMHFSELLSAMDHGQNIFYCSRKLEVADSRGAWFKGAPEPDAAECPGQATGSGWIGPSNRPGTIIGCCLAPAGKPPALPILMQLLHFVFTPVDCLRQL